MFELCIIIICLIINAVLAGSETAFIALNKQTLRLFAKRGDEKAKQMLHLRENPERTLSIIQIGITFVGAFAAAVGGAGAEETLAPWLSKRFGMSDTMSELISILLVVIPITYASVVLGELVPKTLALRRSMFIASIATPWLNLMNKLLNPIVTVFEWSTKKVIEAFPKKHTTPDETEAHSLTLDEVLTPLNKQYIMNMVKIERTDVKEIFLKWKDVSFVNSSDSIDSIENKLITSGHTRLPIVQGGKVIGILNSKEFLAFQKTGDTEWISLCRPTVSLQEITPILTALRLLQEKRAHLAIVYNGLIKTGIITMEAIFEEIIGDIYDEDDDGAIKKILSTIRQK
jgi:putative hemolysin